MAQPTFFFLLFFYFFRNMAQPTFEEAFVTSLCLGYLNIAFLMDKKTSRIKFINKVATTNLSLPQ